jgi:hypothetical protein
MKWLSPQAPVPASDVLGGRAIRNRGVTVVGHSPAVASAKHEVGVAVSVAGESGWGWPTVHVAAEDPAVVDQSALVAAGDFALIGTVQPGAAGVDQVPLALSARVRDCLQ